MPAEHTSGAATLDAATSPKDVNEFIPLLYELLSRTVGNSANRRNSESGDSADTPGSEGDIVAEKGNEAPGGKIAVKALVERPNKDSGETEIIEKEKYLVREKGQKFADYALVTKQIYDADRKLEKTTVEIHSPHIRTALKEVVQYYPSEALKFDPPEDVIFEKPYALLHHHRPELKDYVSKVAESAHPEAETATAHLQLLLDFLDTEVGDDGLALKKLTDAGLINFDLLWAIFKPGDLLFASEYGNPRLYRCRKAGYGEDKRNGRYFDVTCEFTHGDGVKFGTATSSIKLWQSEVFVGKENTAINHLPLFPLRYAQDQEALKASLTERGSRYLDIRGVSTWDYDGLFVYLKQPPYDFYSECASFDGVWLPRSANHRVVVDPKTFIEEATKKAENFDGDGDCDEDGCTSKPNNSKPSALLDAVADPLLCPPFVYGYSLETKEWCKFFLDCLHPVDWIPDAMGSLIVSEAQRNLVQALVSSHQFPDQARNESALKGKGLIILLHGTPGSGKTLTAELAAEQTQRPLLKISTGELGSWGGRIAYELQRLLTYASIWHAIVLIDEADVFLEARQSGPDRFEQNNLVAVFLKQLEYFQGILFMTSNRVNTFDPAIRSRLHLALQYHAPDAERRKLLWKQKLERVSEEDRDLDIDLCVRAMHQAEMNGREISNAVNTALTLAKSGSGRLGLSHLDTVLRVWEEFESTLRSIESAS
ncbi:P-loop containing nucleoside triphosphate hydrolase protein [Macrophomina phaseolina]|uniref:P-loop containing nucleoside triphosphate hydrolase protein n=1 Tax=Macrophomina phaseolina TaxID=35725 RepID=A0ABQ8FU55_9PEZI|nr:P-loop containing nucleoside triphosphate hydrolase protein [Macrophomina phaseolina]